MQTHRGVFICNMAWKATLSASLNESTSPLDSTTTREEWKSQPSTSLRILTLKWLLWVCDVWFHSLVHLKRERHKPDVFPAPRHHQPALRLHHPSLASSITALPRRPGIRLPPSCVWLHQGDRDERLCWDTLSSRFQQERREPAVGTKTQVTVAYMQE